ncbi:hypothetical protein BOX15_Mlig029263g3, partial [Macrostomum lignano]
PAKDRAVMNLSKSGSQQALAPAERYETCPMCSTCVVESRLICQACVRMGNFTAIRDDVTFAQLQALQSELISQKANLESQTEAVANPSSSPSASSALSRRCESRLRLKQLRRALSDAREAVGAERSRRSAARQACAALSREVEAYRRKTADLTAGLNSLRDRYNAGRARAERARHGAAKKARSVCRMIATEVYNLHETERSIVHHRLRLPPLSSFPSRSLEPAPETYQALLAASSLLQALTACLATWTPFQPVPITFMRSPLSRDSVNAQHAKLQVALHSLCNRYHHCLALYAPGDPLLTLCRLLESSQLGVEFASASSTEKNDHQLTNEVEPQCVQVGYDPIHVRAEWELPAVIGSTTSSLHDASCSSRLLPSQAFFPASPAAGRVDEGDDDWVEVDDGFSIPVDESCYEGRSAFLTSLWR